LPVSAPPRYRGADNQPYDDYHDHAEHSFGASASDALGDFGA
jgi:hypothetical protein